jgi:glycosyltransferase involved in cell wall biosynthesis
VRLAALSNTELQPWINWTLLGPPLLEPLAGLPGGRLIAAPPFDWGRRADWLAAVRELRRTDTVFWMQASSRPEWPLWALSASKPTIRRSAFVVDAWRPAISKIGFVAVTQRLDPCFIAFREGRDELKRRFPKGRFEWLTFGIDADAFRPGQGERDVFVYWMGRRYDPLHRALLAYCDERGLTYRYTQVSGGEFADPKDLGAFVGRCRYFVVTPPDLDNPVRTGGYSPLVMRYLEGLAAGARLLGVLPKSGEYEDLLPRSAICEVAADGSDLAERLDADASNAEGWRAVERAGEFVRREHSWRRRAEQIYDRLVGKTTEVELTRLP